MNWSAATWRQIPTVQRRIAVEDDFTRGIAVFWQDSPQSSAIDIDLPHPTILTLGDSKRIAVVVVQAERLPDDRTNGWYDMYGAFAADGRSFVCGADECALGEAVNNRWLHLQGHTK